MIFNKSNIDTLPDMVEGVGVKALVEQLIDWYDEVNNDLVRSAMIDTFEDMLIDNLNIN